MYSIVPSPKTRIFSNPDSGWRERQEPAANPSIERRVPERVRHDEAAERNEGTDHFGHFAIAHW